MYYRTANRPVDRKLFYIDPGPDRFTDSGHQQFTAMPKPNTLQVIQDSLVGIPTYESIGNDLQLIKEHNEKVRRYRSILKDAEVIAASKEETRQENQIQEGVYLRSRLISLRDRILPLVLRMEEDTKSNIDKQAILEKTATLLTERVIGKKEAESSGKILQAFGEQIRNLDIAYSLRKHFYIIAKVCQLLDKNQNQYEYNSVQRLAKNLSRQIKILEVTQSALDMMLRYPAVSKSFYELLDQEKSPNLLRGQFYERLLRLHRFLLDAEGLEQFSPIEADKSHLQEVPADFFITLPLKGLEAYPNDWVSQKQVSGIFNQLKAKISKLSNSGELEKIWNAKDFSYDKQENESGFVNILRQVELATEALIQGSQISSWQEVLSQFTNFRELDQVLYPFEYLTDITEKELIHTVRISPNDAQMGFGKNKNAKDKLAGETLYAFGGFFKKSWRSNDILWGRLDGLNRIVEALITTESVQRFPEFLKRQAREQNYHQDGEEFEAFKEKYIEFLVKQSLPHSQPLDRLKIIDYLRKLANPEQFSAERLQNLLKDFLDDLVREGHREILSTDLQNVIADEIDEQLNWNRQRVDLTEPNQKPKYSPVAGYFDRSVSALAAGTLAKEAIEDLVRTQGDRGLFS
jgi:patatin-related protein